APLPRMLRYRVISGWSRLMLWCLRVLCGIRWRVEGREHLPATPSVILAKHQSAWETLAFQQIFPPQVHVLKRDLLWLPFFGWGLALMSPIPIDRGRGLSALRQMARRGKVRLQQGFWVVVFPEGTRVAPGEHRKYRLGGAWLAAHAGAPVVPVAHNAGRYWPRNSFLKYAGEVRVRIGPPIESAGREPETINAMAEEWIETQQKSLDS
ncbi:MAG TPA: lysophospholipid acyltransferase family protein, partial [Roseiflexaceae bacterium]